MKPTYQAFMPPGFETVEDTRIRALRLINLPAPFDSSWEMLCRTLASCKKAKPCNSGACPYCTRKFRIWLLRQGLTVMENGGPPAFGKAVSTPYWTAASIIPAGLSAAPGKLASLDLATIIKRVAKNLERSALAKAFVIGGLDFSLNSTDNDNAFWQAHLYLLISGKPNPEFKQAIRAAFPPEPTACRPYRSTLVYSPRGALTYCLKNIFARRSTYHWRQKQYVQHLPLTNVQQRELAIFLHSGPSGERLILRGLRRSGQELVAIIRNQ